MNQYLEFVSRHPLLFAALAGVITWMVVAEFRRLMIGAKGLSAREAIQLINHGAALMIDIRDEKDFKKGHIIGAKNLPMVAIEEKLEGLAPDKDRPVIAYCSTGNKAAYACATLKKHGFKTLFYLRRGLYGWLNENLPVEK